jgi:hypothetical protein
MGRDFGRKSRHIAQQNAEEETQMKKLEEIYHGLAKAK